jgi:hypothetical protein
VRQGPLALPRRRPHS